ncbi:MAG: PH domain-containing protein, partial [Acidimicrobiia bacterium]
ITTERVIHRAGFISKKGKEIPLEVINDVAFTQTALERILGSGDLLVESAGEEGQSLYHHIPDPEGLQSLIYRVREDRMMAIEGGHRATSTAEQLQILAHLHDEGRLSDEEFETEKSKLLGGEQPRPE